ncbi:bone morphogenetic protein 1-like isoform X2 [Fopius arisanus]|uniref:Bone morphogenetic protein 1-like isoform X2 n=1 Tax=Fopius arisanus TaxID=64838 RepID=A0A9R1U6J3_9HYME|nr:PREDICTED: bone morphogenetic protein 1-like isoform X2 [Fopius arisanus]
MASVLWHASGSSFVSPVIIILLLLYPHSIAGREVIDVPLPQQDYVPSLPPPPPPPGPITTAKTPRCDQTFVSKPGGSQNGTFHAPTLINPEGESQQCVYTFLAAPHQRVEIVFTSFGLRGTPPECFHEYMDVYTEIRSDNATKLIETPFGGRYCGPIPPRRRVSLYQGIALSFFTDKNITQSTLFSGRYSFINASEYEVGTPAPSTPCSFVVNSTIKRTGTILSPTYPGTYPKDLACTYKFLGEPGQRVRLEFRDFDLFYGGSHCPFDYVKVFDGLDKSAPVIGTYCGQQRNLVLYSSQANLTVLFVTLQRNANTQNRGFKGIFEFSESFVKLDFINNSGGMHIRGSECDQKILSMKKSSGHVVSPNYPYPYIPKVVCRYFIYGMQDSQHLERVRLEFQAFDITKGETKGDSACTDGYLKIYLKGQEATDSYDKFDHEMCGNVSNPSQVVSDGPRLVMVFSSGESKQGRGFKANYSFETEYKIPGTPAPDGSCNFTYLSSSRKKGEFNSPRYPSNYPSDTNCTYLFVATPNEQVTLVFDHFKVRTRNINLTVGHYGAEECQDDWLEIYNMYRDNTEKLIGRYCWMTAPGPVESNLGALGLKVILHSDSELVYSGFKARYTFEVTKSIFGDCGANISSLEYGLITSPNFPEKYDGPPKYMASKTCNWFISVRPNHRILLNFELFSVEGEQSARGCPAAVLRMWFSLASPPIELCGGKPTEVSWSYMSDDNNMRLSFISSDKAVGQLGFRAVWTEVSLASECEPDEFHCGKSKYCIAETLRCNNIDNCGPEDGSDEDNCTTIVPPVSYAIPVAGAAAAVILAMIICLLCHRKLKRRPQEVHIDDLQQRVEDVRYCYRHHSLPQRTSSMHSHGHTHNYSDQYHLDQPSPPSDSEHVCGEDISSPESP